MKFALLLVTSAIAFNENESAFLSYISQFGKTYYNLAEYKNRRIQFIRNYEAIQEHNMTESSFKLGLNKLADWTEEEYLSILTLEDRDVNGPFMTATGVEVEPKDWRDLGAVNEIKDQGQCGSCWAFSTIAALEGAHFVKSDELLSLAEQQLVDCDKGYGDHGCYGGWQENAYTYFKEHEAILEDDYEYFSGHKGTGGACQYDELEHTGVKVANYAFVDKNSPSAMKEALMKQPLAVCIEADQRVFQNYKEGIFNSSKCGTKLDHATNVIGWGEEEGVEFWIMRNSWGTTWGEAGYMRLEITKEGSKGTCGIH